MVRPLRLLGAALFLCSVLAQDNSNGPLTPPNSDYRWANADAVSKWHDLKFGLRIHWGSYAIHGLGPESWPLNSNGKNQSFLKWYWDQAKSWRPASFDADDWIALMRRSGIRFFDFTTKHHEGFSMYNTSTKVHDCWAFDTAATAKPAVTIQDCAGSADGHAFSSAEVFGRDVTGELVAAARRGGVEPGLYFSHIDWYDADMRIDQWNAVASPKAGNLCAGQPCDPSRYSRASNSTEWNRFVLRHRAQIVEVLTKYGEVLEMSFDMDFPSSFDADMYETIMLARQLAPNTLFRGRGMGGYKGSCDETLKACGMGDYETPEEVFPDSPLPGNWQVIFHGSHFMSYDPVAANYVNGSFIVWHLVDIVAKGGLMQIGYGPDVNGNFHPKAVEALEYAGRWLTTNGEAIYSTRPMASRWNDSVATDVRYTRSKDNSIVYAILLDMGGMPRGSLVLGDVRPANGSTISLLGYEDEATRQPISIQWEQTGSQVHIFMPDDLAAHPKLAPPGLAFKIRVS